MIGLCEHCYYDASKWAYLNSNLLFLQLLWEDTVGSCPECTNKNCFCFAVYLNNAQVICESCKAIYSFKIPLTMELKL